MCASFGRTTKGRKVDASLPHADPTGAGHLLCIDDGLCHHRLGVVFDGAEFRGVAGEVAIRTDPHAVDRTVLLNSVFLANPVAGSTGDYDAPVRPRKIFRHI